MRIKSIFASEVLPVKKFEVENLSDVVVIAGPNGVGKSRLIQGLISFCQNPNSNSNVRLIIEATSKSEEEMWGKKQLDTHIPEDSNKLRTILQRNQKRRNLKSSIVNFESDRTLKNINTYQFSWDIPDPDEEVVGWNTTLGYMSDRYNDTLHSIFKKIEHQKKSIANRAITLQKEGKTQMNLDFEDPVAPFKVAFSQLLGPKVLLDPSAAQQRLMYQSKGVAYDLQGSLSSGEREIINIVFDFILRNPNDCIIIFDEPELHLHPEFSYKLIQILKTIGSNNQFIFCTHSPDIITSALDNSVIFLSPENIEGANQAVVVNEDDDTNQALKLLGQSIGIVALGKKIVLIEGGESSLDKQVYGSIIKNLFPNLVLVPAGGKELIKSFSTIVDQVLSKSIWGVGFYMLCDGDSAANFSGIDRDIMKQTPRFKILNSYHLENYFLNEDILSEIFKDMEPEESWLRSPVEIHKKLKEIALGLISYTAALNISGLIRSNIGNTDIMPKNSHNKTSSELSTLICDKAKEENTRIAGSLEDTKLKILIESEYKKVNDSFLGDSNEWKKIIPGKSILAIFCSGAKIQLGRLKILYLAKAFKEKVNPFKEIIDIFEYFNKS